MSSGCTVHPALICCSYMPEQPIRVMIVDDEPRLCSAWQRIISAEQDMTFVGALRSADTIIEAVAAHHPDVVLLDLILPGRDALEALAEVARTNPATRVVMYSGYNDEETVNKAIDNGGWGLVDKLSSPQSILDVIRRVFGGEMCFPAGYR